MECTYCGGWHKTPGDCLAFFIDMKVEEFTDVLMKIDFVCEMEALWTAASDDNKKEDQS